MDFVSKLNEAIIYIENNLDSEIDINEIEKIVGKSYYHFQKTFYYMTSITLSEYIRRRKMTLSCYELQHKNSKIIDIALKYGYDSPTAFTRAFKKMYGIAPKDMKDNINNIVYYPPISLNLEISGKDPILYSIVKKSEFKILGEKFSTSIDECYHQKIAEFWSKKTKEGLITKLIYLNNTIPEGILGVTIGDWGMKNEFDYYIAVATTESVNNSLHELSIPESWWAIFECVGTIPESIRNLHNRIIYEWFPQSGYEYSNLPDIEVYLDSDTSSSRYRTQIWIPIKMNN